MIFDITEFFFLLICLGISWFEWSNIDSVLSHNHQGQTYIISFVIGSVALHKLCASYVAC